MLVDQGLETKADTIITSAAHLKFLRRKRQIPFRNFKWKGAL
jgi:hypothetical protein